MRDIEIINPDIELDSGTSSTGRAGIRLKSEVHRLTIRGGRIKNCSRGVRATEFGTTSLRIDGVFFEGCIYGIDLASTLQNHDSLFILNTRVNTATYGIWVQNGTNQQIIGTTGVSVSTLVRETGTNLTRTILDTDLKISGVYKQRIAAAGLPTTSHFPSDGDSGIYVDTLGSVYHCYNRGGAILKVVLS